MYMSFDVQPCQSSGRSIRASEHHMLEGYLFVKTEASSMNLTSAALSEDQGCTGEGFRNPYLRRHKCNQGAQPHRLLEPLCQAMQNIQ